MPDVPVHQAIQRVLDAAARKGVTLEVTTFSESTHTAADAAAALGAERDAPVAVSGGVTFAQIAVEAGHTCGITASEAVYCWGRNSYGELGDGTKTNSPVPVRGKGT